MHKKYINIQIQLEPSSLNRNKFSGHNTSGPNRPLSATGDELPKLVHITAILLISTSFDSQTGHGRGYQLTAQRLTANAFLQRSNNLLLLVNLLCA